MSASFALRLERECSKDVTHNGIHMKKGMLVSVATYPLHYSEEYYSEPHKFDPDRSVVSSYSFGGGVVEVEVDT